MQLEILDSAQIFHKHCKKPPPQTTLSESRAIWEAVNNAETQRVRRVFFHKRFVSIDSMDLSTKGLALASREFSTDRGGSVEMSHKEKAL